MILKRVYILSCVYLCMLLAGCSDFFYNTHIANYGKYGVTFLKSPITSYYNNNEPASRIEPGRPNVNIRKGYSFNGSRDQLPKEPKEIVWQLSKLTDCKYVRGPYKSDDPDYPGMFTGKSGCTWTPLPDKIFRKTIDFQALKKSEHFKRSGENADGFSLIPRFADKRIMEITLVFRDNEMDVNLSSHITNPWK